MMRKTAVLALATMITACGGGGGGGGGTPPLGPEDATVAITAGNAIAIIRSVADTDAIAQDLIISTLLGAAAASAAQISNPPTAATASPAAQSAEFCNGGNADVSEEGLTVTFDFIDCINFNYSSANLGDLAIAGEINGMLQVQVAGSSTSEDDFNATVTLTDFSIDRDGTLSWGDGQLLLDYLDAGSTIQVDIDSSAFDFSRNDATRSLENYNYFLTTNGSNQSETSGGGLLSADFSGLAVFTTNQPFTRTVGDPWPAAGVRNIYGEDDARIRVAAIDGNTARVQVDIDSLAAGFELDCTYAWNVLLGTDSLIACAQE
jgi:hypothetical protein